MSRQLRQRTVLISPVKGKVFVRHLQKWREPSTKSFVSREDVLDSVRSYIVEESLKPFCIDLRGRETKCTCLHIFRDNPTVVLNCAREVLSFFEMDSSEQTNYFLKWKRSADAVAVALNRQEMLRKFLMLAEPDDSNPDSWNCFATMPPHYHCVNGACKLLAMGKSRYGRIINTTTNAGGWKHGNSNNNNRNKRMLDVFQSIDDFLTEMEKQADPISSRKVRSMVGVKLRGDKDLILLPPNMKYRQIYQSWVWSRGWKIVWVSRALNQYAPLDQWNDRPFDTDEWPEGSMKKDICAWNTFLNQWKITHPNLRIRPRGEDTCSKCWKMSEELRGITKQKTRCEGFIAAGLAATGVATAAEVEDAVANEEEFDEEEGYNNDESASNDGVNEELGHRGGVADDSDDEMEEYDEVPTLPAMDELEADLMEAQGEFVQIMEQYDACVFRCSSHIREYVAQRELLDEYIDQAKKDASSNAPLHQKTVVLTTDMMQKAAVPSLASEQMDVAYYYSPMTQHVSGWADNVSESMNIYVWGEGVAGSGANEITSCFYADLKNRGYLEQGLKLFHLVLVADNCGGQNKNKTMLRFCMWLVECGYMIKVTLLFLVKGHTKNICDRMFNLVKLSYHDLNIYSEAMLDEALSCHAQISLFRLHEDGFKNFEQFFYDFYVETSVTKFHLFEFGVLANTPTKLRKSTHSRAMGDEVEWATLQPSMRTKRKWRELNSGERLIMLRQIENNILPLISPGLPPIKQYELYKKWRKITPEEFKNVTCPKPSESVLAMFRDPESEFMKKLKEEAAKKKKEKDELKEEAAKLKKEKDGNKKKKKKTHQPEKEIDEEQQQVDMLEDPNNEPDMNELSLIFGATELNDF
jgi:hypothetical protein